MAQTPVSTQPQLLGTVVAVGGKHGYCQCCGNEIELLFGQKLGDLVYCVRCHKNTVIGNDPPAAEKPL